MRIYIGAFIHGALVDPCCRYESTRISSTSACALISLPLLSVKCQVDVVSTWKQSRQKMMPLRALPFSLSSLAGHDAGALAARLPVDVLCDAHDLRQA